jgi:predicted DNA-binding transcriptional regulator YafY
VRRADRLFRLVQQLRRRRRAVTAAQLALALDVTERTVYRDVRDLVLSGVPIRGEAGVGYVLAQGYDLPPLMFTETEIEALVLGARMVKEWADERIAAAAEDVLAKVEAVLPAQLKERVAGTALHAFNFHERAEERRSLGVLREAVRLQRKVRLSYRDGAKAATERTVRPLGLFYWGPVWSLGAWCEMRQDFRTFRLDRMSTIRVLDEPFAAEPGRTLEDLFEYYRSEGAER